MPCMDGGPSYAEIAREANADAAKLSKACAELKQRLDRATRVACELGRNLPKGKRTLLSDEAIDWLEEHKEADEKRMLREKALAKLTPEERKALGIKDE